MNNPKTMDDDDDNDAKLNMFYYILYILSSIPLYIEPTKENRDKLIESLKKLKPNYLNEESYIPQ